MKPIDAFSALQASIPRLWHGEVNAALTREDDAWWIACGDGQPYFAIAADAAGLDVRIDACETLLFDVSLVYGWLRSLKPTKDERLSVSTEGNSLVWRLGDRVAALKLPIVRIEDMEKENQRRHAFALELLPARTGRGDVVVRFQEGVLPIAYAACKPAIATEETRLYLNGMRIESGGFVATDGRKLVHVPVPVEGLEEPFTFSRWALALIMRPAVLREWRDEKPELINVDDRKYFRAGGVICGPVDIEGFYPDWRRVVPEREILSYRATFRTRELLEAMASLGLRKKDALGVRIHDSGYATLAGHGARIDVSCTVSMPERRESATFTIGLSAEYVRQLARALDPRSKGTVTLLMQSAEGALRVEGGESPALVVLMPMRISEKTMFGEKETA